MGRVTFPEAVAFDGYDWAMTKAQALKVLEESAELVEAVKEYLNLPGCPQWPDNVPLRKAQAKAGVLDEAMDVYQALANLLAGEFSDGEIADAYGRCLGRNRERGRL